MFLSPKRQTALLYRRPQRLRLFFVCTVLCTLALVSWLNISFNDLIEILPPGKYKVSTGTQAELTFIYRHQRTPSVLPYTPLV
jgi:hypothetical protein